MKIIYNLNLQIHTGTYTYRHTNIHGKTEIYTHVDMSTLSIHNIMHMYTLCKQTNL